ncbi:MAG: outer membrane beta-barrel family protein, partial [Paramuribaculum sp.]|nr:outer membrane beta-barrel family protein [Paramuribaculum sp.]
MIPAENNLNKSVWRRRVINLFVMLSVGVLGVCGKSIKDLPLVLRGEVVESLGHSPLKGVRVALLDSGYNEIDTIISGDEYEYMTFSNGPLPAVFKLKMPRKSGRYYISFEHEKYNPFVKTLDIGHIGGRELQRDLGKVVLVKAPRQLGEVTVTATKVKFYNKGDTLVYNADAFELPEGSMLDALVAQLPGVEIKENGQIYVNGKFVENLILNGKDFFAGNSQVMLENLGAYMVKDVAVYEQAGEKSKFMGRDMGDKSYVMDVRLKKEYRQGWIANIEGGAGTNSRYMGRFFGMRYTDFTRVGVYANVNNLSDNGRQDERGGFDPAKRMPGSKRHRNAGMTYNASTRDDRLSSSGNIIWAHTASFDDERTTRTNFLPGGDNYSYHYKTGKGISNMVRGNTGTYYEVSKSVKMNLSVIGNYSSFDNRYDNLDATFNTEQTEMTRNLLDSLYITSNPAVNEMVNRIAKKTASKGHNFSMDLGYNNWIKVPYTSDMMQVWMYGKYIEERTRSNSLYRINTGRDYEPKFNEGQWYDTKPNRGYEINSGVSYNYLSRFVLEPRYEFTHRRKVKNQLTHIMDNLADLGIYGLTAPVGAEYSTDDSYWSNTSSNIHDIGAKFNIWFKGKMNISLNGGVQLVGANLWYNRFNKPFKIKRHSIMPVVKEAMAQYEWGKARSNYGTLPKNIVKLIYKLNGNIPELEWLLPITDNTDPMNIYEGAETLKNQFNHNWELSWSWKDSSRPFNHKIELTYALQSNALVRGYTYDTATGVRRIRSYNTSGNWSEGANSIVSLQFGPKRKMALSNNAGISYGHATDMIGTNVETPA